MQQNQWQRENSLQSALNMQQLLNDFIIVMNCCKNRETNKHALQSVHIMLKRKHYKLSNEATLA